MTQIQPIFSEFDNQSYPYRFIGEARVATMVGGTPADPNVAESWLKTKLGQDAGDQIRTLIAEFMVEQGLTVEQATDKVNKLKNLNRIRRDTHGLFYEGRCLKAALKEAVSIAVAAGKVEKTKWGATSKWLTNFFPEHVFVVENRIYLHRDGAALLEPDEVLQQFVRTQYKTSAIQLQEMVREVDITFTVITDYDFSEKDWAMIWTTGQQNGMGASRSMGFGTYVMTRWEQVSRRPAPTLATPRVVAKRTTRRETS